MRRMDLCRPVTLPGTRHTEDVQFKEWSGNRGELSEEEAAVFIMRYRTAGEGSTDRGSAEWSKNQRGDLRGALVSNYLTVHMKLSRF